MLRCCSVLILSIALLSCQGGISRATQSLETYTPSTQAQETIIPSPSTQAALTRGTKILSTPTQTFSASKTLPPTTFTPKIITPDIINADINYLPELSGSLYIGSSDNGIYVKVDFDNNRASRLQLPNDCLLLSSGLKAVCAVMDNQNIKEIYIYDMLTRQRDFSDKRDIRRLDLTSSERLLAYTPIGPEGVVQTMAVYDFETKTTFNIENLDKRGDTLRIPWLSNSGKAMIGVNVEESPWESDDAWYRMDTKIMKAEPMPVPDNIAATDSVEWSPDDSLVALVGFYRDDEIPQVGILQCKKVVLFYDPKAQGVRFSAKVPEGRCFTPIAFYQDSLWSSDNSKLALVLDEQDICIVEVAKPETGCISITDYTRTEKMIRSLAWSPDSNYLAYINTDGEIMVFSFQDQETYIIGNVDDLNTFFLPIGNKMVWGRE